MVSNLVPGNAKPKPAVYDIKLDRHEAIYNPNDGYENFSIRRKKSFYIGTYAAIFVLVALSTLIVVLPVLDRINIDAFNYINRKNVPCGNICRFELVETIPEGLTYDGNANYTETFEVWKHLVNNAKESIDIASFYWTMRENEEYEHPSSIKGEEIYQGLLDAGLKRNISIRIAQNEPSTFRENTDTEYLAKVKAAMVRSVNMTKLIGAGVLHTKFWIVDRKHLYLGSANMDWRALTQVKELGVAVYDCPCIAEDLGKIFDVYWFLGDAEKVPETWPDKYSTTYNKQTPMNVTLNGKPNLLYISSSPPRFSPRGRTDDIDALLWTISNAKRFIYISVMDYFPLSLYTNKNKFWPLIDNEIRRAIIDRGVNVRILISQWKNTRPMIYNFMNSLKSLNRFNKKVKVEVKKFKVQSTPPQQSIPFARVNHNKYMVTDNGVFIGTSNWSADYFIDTAGVSFVMPSEKSMDDSIRSQLVSIFERDWSSKYAADIY